MGDGLKRAFAAAARTRADASLTPEMRKFLDALAPHSEPVTRGKIGCVTNRADDRARQACRRFGYADYRRREDGKKSWAITPLGRQVRAPSASATEACKAETGTSPLGPAETPEVPSASRGGEGE